MWVTTANWTIKYCYDTDVYFERIAWNMKRFSGIYTHAPLPVMSPGNKKIISMR